MGETNTWTRAVMQTAGTDELPLMIEASTVDASGTAGVTNIVQKMRSAWPLSKI